MDITPMQAKEAAENLIVTNPKEWETRVNEVFTLANQKIRQVEQTSVQAIEQQVLSAQEVERSAAKAFNAAGDAFQELRQGNVVLSGDTVKRVNAVRDAALENVKALRREAGMLDHFAGQLADPEAYAETLIDRYAVLRSAYPHI